SIATSGAVPSEGATDPAGFNGWLGPESAIDLVVVLVAIVVVVLSTGSEMAGNPIGRHPVDRRAISSAIPVILFMPLLVG
ncbi:MAG: hypothetical protein OEM81_14285, partial [Acidimicrobiia bacterium]|nr:hypothetical protein [Acidimicrobiia bacterium]